MMSTRQTAFPATILVANRGEIAVRVMATLRRLGIGTVAVYSDADHDARHVREADVSVRLGPAAPRESYLNIPAVLEAARRTHADAIHPGYGFLSENPAFAQACSDAGVQLLGPSADAMRVMGDKIAARATVSARGVPVVPGVSKPGLSDDDLIAAAAAVGYPILIKPSAGGGGKGMRAVHQATELAVALAASRRESASAFGDDTLFLERFVHRPRHIEIQVLADRHGNVVHLGERECSLQRRHQKVVEEAPSVLLGESTRKAMGASACEAARSVGYEGVGTVEFIVSADAPNEFFFMEMNTRLQVEHPVTEMVTGLDLVEWQVRVAAGQPLSFGQTDVTMTGHAIEARLYAEDPSVDFLPTGGRILAVRIPGGDPNDLDTSSVRVDSGVREGFTVGSNYDPMLAKVIARGADRREALQRLDSALAETAVLGVRTNVDFLRHVLASERVGTGDLDTTLLDRLAEDYVPLPPPEAAYVVAAMSRTEARWNAMSPEQRGPWDVPNGWRLGGSSTHNQRAEVLTRFDVGAGSEPVTVGLRGTPQNAVVTLSRKTVGGAENSEDSHSLAAQVSRDGPDLRLTLDDVQHRWTVIRDDSVFWVAGAGGCWSFRLLPLVDSRIHRGVESDGILTSPMPGTVIAVHEESGADVESGQPLLTVEAMKMEHTLMAPVAGVVTYDVEAGAQVQAGAQLAVVRATAQHSDSNDSGGA